MRLFRSCRLPSMLLLASLSCGGTAVAADGSYSADVDLGPIPEPIEAKRCESALVRLHADRDMDPDNPGITSLPGFICRKTRRYEAALGFYQWALSVEPEHRGANEYLGELYLQTGQIDKALRQLEILDDTCAFGCDEYTQLKKAIESYRADGSAGQS